MARLPARPTRRLPPDLTAKLAGRASYDRPSSMQLMDPEPGYFKLRRVRGGPWVPAIIWRPCPLIMPEPLEATPAPEEWCCPTERSRVLRARIGDQEASPDDVWASGRRISPKEYALRLAVRTWALTYAPAQPEANERQPVDLKTLPSLF